MDDGHLGQGGRRLAGAARGVLEPLLEDVELPLVIGFAPVGGALLAVGVPPDGPGARPGTLPRGFDVDGEGLPEFLRELLRELLGVADELVRVQVFARTAREGDEVPAGVEGPVALDPGGQGEQGPLVVLGLVPDVAEHAFQRWRGGQDGVLGAGEEGHLGEAGLGGRAPQAVPGGPGVDPFEEILVDVSFVTHVEVHARDVHAGGLGERRPGDAADHGLRVLLLVHHEDDLARGAGHPLGAEPAAREPGRGSGAAPRLRVVPLPSLRGPRGPQGVVCPLLETDELGGGADAVPQTGRGEDVALVPVGLEHDELHGDPLGRGGACAVCHV